MTVDPKALESAQRQVVVAMGAAMALSWTPFVGGILSGIAETKLVESLLVTLGRKDDEETVDALTGFFGKKMLFLGVATLAPAIGSAVQVVLTWGLGQLVIRCATDDDFDAMDERWLDARWAEIRGHIFSGDNVVTSYRQFAARPFPARFEKRVIRVVDWMNAVYGKAESLPGVAKTQDALGGALQRTARGAKKRLRGLRKRLSK
ncbi:MAG TPA: hypothetical protein VIF62_07140 [Labilithrix sp.]|jgi:hypothetical protein